MDDSDRIRQLIARGEGPTLELKPALPSPHHLAREIAAFANADGGIILLGVRDDGSAPGVNVIDADKALRAALELLTPKPEALLTRLGALTTAVVEITVAADPAGPIQTPDGVFRRSDSGIEALPAETIRERTLLRVSADLREIVTPLAGTIESLTQRVLELERQVVAGQTLRRRAPDMLVGAIISAVLGLLLASFL